MQFFDLSNGLPVSVLRRMSFGFERAPKEDIAHCRVNLFQAMDRFTLEILFSAETIEFLENFQKRQIIGIEMKASAIFTTPNLQDMNVMTIHIISDNPMIGKPLVGPLSPDDENRYKKSTEALRDVTLRIVAGI